MTQALAAPAPIVTSTQGRTDTEKKDFGIGLTSSIAQRPFVGVDDQDASLLYLSFQYQRFYIEGLDVGFDLYKTDKYKVGLLATPRFYEVEPAFAPGGELDGIDITKPSYFAGISNQIFSDHATYTIQLLHDLDDSDGNEVVVQAGKTYRVTDNVTLTPSIGLTYQDDNLVDYFYGVQAHEAAAGRPQYTGKGTFNYNVTANVRWAATKHIELLGQLKYEVLGSGITDSPIVDEDAVYAVTIGAVYYFR